MSLGKLLIKLRNKKKVMKRVTIKDVSKKTKIPESTLYFIESGRTKNPSEEILKELAKYYEIEKRALIEAMYEL